MSRRFAFLFCLAALASCGPAIAQPTAKPDDFFTRKLPEPDRAEVILAQSFDQTDSPRVSLRPKDAHALATLLRAQSWEESGKDLPHAQYTLSFYAKGKLIVSESICFHCECVFPVASDLHPIAGAGRAFDSTTPEASALEDFLDNLFATQK